VLFRSKHRRYLYKFLAITIAATSCLIVPASHAGEEGAGTYGAPYVNIPVGAKLMALPDVVAAMDPDVSLMFSNPAALGDISESQVFFSTSNWLEYMRYNAAGVVVPLGRSGITMSVGSVFLYSGGLKGYDDALNVVSEDNYYDLSLQGALTKRFDSIGLTLGAGGTYLRQHTLPSDGNGYAFTVGAAFERRHYYAYGVGRNIGGKVIFEDRWYPVDSQQIVGVGRRFNLATSQLMLGAQMVYTTSAPTTFEVGVDYRLNRYVSVRTGVKDIMNDATDGLGLDAGFGVNYGRISFGYAYSSHEYFSGTHTFSLVFAVTKAGPSFMEEAAATSSEPVGTADPGQAPPLVEQQTAPVMPSSPAAQKLYLVIAGSHGWEESAAAEVRSLQLLDVPSSVVSIDGAFTVVIGSYESRSDALSAIRKYREQGHSFRLYIQTNY